MSIHTTSVWEGTAEQLAAFSSFEGDHETDIAIVGGGITGITAARLLSEEGKNVVVLEAMKIGLGTTGNSTGNLYVTVDEHLSGIRKKWNADVMKAVVQSRNSALNHIENNIHLHNINCAFSRQPFTYFAETMNSEVEDFVKAEYDAMHEAGLEANLSDQAGLPFKTVKALRIENQAQFHPLRYVQQLAHAISGKCQIYENSRVMDIDEKKGIIKTEKGTLKANKILLATHTPIGVYGVQTVLAPYREFGIAAEVESFPGGIFWGMNQPKHSVRSFQHGGKNFVMVIGDKFKTGQHGDTREYVNGLEKYLRDRLPVSTVKYVWGGQQYRAADALPYIGKHREHIYFLTGFATDGLIYGTLAAIIVSDLILERANPWSETYKASRFTPLKSAKDFIVENADAVKEYLTDTPWNVDVKKLNEIKPGEGKLIEHNQQKLAVYREESGKTHIVSAVCTHMKCIVNWNQSEKTWDCPCHGSRFGFDGHVIEGPALSPLEKPKK